MAIKIIKSDAQGEFRSQVASLRKALKFMVAVYPKLGRVADPLGVLESVEKSTLRELDLRTELAGIGRLRGLRDEGVASLPHLEKLEFPKVYEEFSNSEILVSEWRSEPARICSRSDPPWPRSGSARLPSREVGSAAPSYPARSAVASNFRRVRAANRQHVQS